MSLAATATLRTLFSTAKGTMQGDRPGNMAIAATLNFIFDRLDLEIAKQPAQV